MAKLQRWRRRSPAGEGTGPATTVDTVDGVETIDGVDAVDGVEKVEPVDGVDPDDGVETVDGVRTVDGVDPDDAADADEPVLLAETEETAEERGTAPDGDDATRTEVDDPAPGTTDEEPESGSATTYDPEPDDGADPEPEAQPEPATAATPTPSVPPAPERRGPAGWSVVLLAQSAHLKQAVFTALCLAGVAALVGRAPREAGVIAVTVLVGQMILGWHNDIVDAEKDRAHGARGKPIADGRLAVGTAWYAITVAALVLVPLAITTGITAGSFYLGAVAVAMIGNVIGRTGFLSWWSWAASFALYPAYLSYGGWGGQAVGDPPEVSITVLAALLGVGVHFMRAVWGLVADHEAGWTYLPLKLGLRLGATRLLALSTLFTVGVAVALVVVGARVGLEA